MVKMMLTAAVVAAMTTAPSGGIRGDRLVAPLEMDIDWGGMLRSDFAADFRRADAPEVRRAVEDAAQDRGYVLGRRDHR